MKPESNSSETAPMEASKSDEGSEESEDSWPTINDQPIGTDIKNLAEHVAILSKPLNFAVNPDYDGFALEFEWLERGMDEGYSYTAFREALQPHNRAKNRYSNVLPLDATRVRLKEVEGEEGSDYINANYVSGLFEKEYICSQGPLPHTLADFWRMVWEQRSNVIIMLTGLIESDRVKCHTYWPAKRSEVYGEIKVTILETVEEGHLEKRKLSVQFLETREKRVVWHLQYKKWPDHGLPASAFQFRKLVHWVDELRDGKQPLIVHCSAGIGRTGTFCAVHQTIEKLHKFKRDNPGGAKPTFNILSTIRKLRKHRVGMVQTKEQFEFVYRAILEEVQAIWKEVGDPVPPVVAPAGKEEETLTSPKKPGDGGTGAPGT